MPDVRAGKWQVKKNDQNKIDILAGEFNISKIAATCLFNRGYHTPRKAKVIFDKRLSRLEVPENMADMAKAAIRTVRAIKNKESVGLFGDYDADGVTSSAILSSYFTQIGFEHFVELADRDSGYGMVPEFVGSFAEKGCTLIIALDCGTSDHKAMQYAAEKGIDVIVIDHHRVDSGFPKATAFVNPQRNDCEFTDKNMSAAGLAFYFVAKIRTEITKQKIKIKDIDPRTFLDLAAIGTVADVVPLIGNNRILVDNGLKLIQENPRPGVKALIDVCRIRTSKLNTAHISFQLAPRINAAGRLKNAKAAFDLLVETDYAKAVKFAQNLNKLSSRRKEIELDVFEEAMAEVKKKNLNKLSAVVVHGENWHKGVIGIVASRLVEKLNKPSYIISFDGDTGTGSARSDGFLDLYASLKHASKQLERYGGHKGAAGFSLLRKDVEQFSKQVNNFALGAKTPKDRISYCDTFLTPQDLTKELLGDLEKLSPFGQEFAAPVFLIHGLKTVSKKVVGKNHLKMEFATPDGTISAFGPFMGDMVKTIDTTVDAVANINADEWRGGGQLELKLIDLPGGEN